LVCAGSFGTQDARQQLDARPASLDFDEIQRIERSCAHEDAELYIELIDAAIHYANTKLQGEGLTRLLRGEAGGIVLRNQR